MSDSDDKFKHSKRLQKEENAIHRQQKIAKTHGAPEHQTESHRYSKHHAMNCGDPKCVMCGNPRKTFKELTAQEKKLFQDLDRETDRKSNGIKPKEEE
jgi:uncharacterized protein YdaU (DUF1376 family)